MAFGFLITPSSLTFTNLEGKTQTVTSSHDNFLLAKEKIKEIQNLIKDTLYEDVELDDAVENHVGVLFAFEELENLIAPIKKIIASGEVTIENGVLYYEGSPINNTLTNRIIWGISEGFDMDPYVNFLKNLMQNTSHRSIEQLFDFIERHKMGITEDGFILGYKRVTENFKDLHTRTMDNSPGTVVTMPRNKVSDNPNDTCSSGLHFCSMSYLPSFGVGGGNKIVIVKVNPKDVVSVPVDHNAAKVRCCEYLVVSEYTGSDKDDILGSKAVFNETEFYKTEDDSRWDVMGNEDEDEDDDNSSCVMEDYYFVPPPTIPTDEEMEKFHKAELEALRKKAKVEELEGIISAAKKYNGFTVENDELVPPNTGFYAQTDSNENVELIDTSIGEVAVSDSNVEPTPETPVETPQEPVQPVLNLFGNDAPENISNLLKGL
jgi:hypothetical protein